MLLDKIDHSQNNVLDLISNHEATKHPLFNAVRELAENNKLNYKQFEIFRHYLFSRVFLTIPSITTSLRSAIINRQANVIETTFKNLCEELSFDTPYFPKTHADLMEECFNCIGKAIFNLEPTTLKFCFDNPRSSEEIVYRNTVQGIYNEYPIIASLAQELSSGGTNIAHESGMMLSMYRATIAIYKANSSLISDNQLCNEILPYFSCHLNIQKDLEISKDHAGIEFEHGQRALNDFHAYKDYFTKPSSIINAFLDVQSLIFNQALKEIIYNS